VLWQQIPKSVALRGFPLGKKIWPLFCFRCVSAEVSLEFDRIEARINPADNLLSVIEITDPAVALAAVQKMVEEEKEKRERESAALLASQGKVLDESLVSKRVVYELVGVVAEIHTGSEPPHLVAHVRGKKNSEIKY